MASGKMDPLQIAQVLRRSTCSGSFVQRLIVKTDTNLCSWPCPTYKAGSWPPTHEAGNFCVACIACLTCVDCGFQGGRTLGQVNQQTTETDTRLLNKMTKYWTNQMNLWQYSCEYCHDSSDQFHWNILQIDSYQSWNFSDWKSQHLTCVICLQPCCKNLEKPNSSKFTCNDT